MASFTERLAYLITGNSDSAVRAFKKTGDAGHDSLGKADAAVGKLKLGIGGLATAVKAGIAGVAASALVSFGNELLNLGVKVDVWRRKTATVFEGAAGDVRRWADANNEAFGLTDDELSGLAASFGDLLKPMGFTAQQAAAMSTEVVGLAGALSAWSGGQRSAAEVADILAKAMLGERDSLKSLGISITEADVQARLAAKGQKDLAGAVLEQAKALATQELIFEKSTDAQKAWADGSMDATKAQNELTAEWKEAKETLATELTPALIWGTKALTVVAHKTTELGRDIDDVVDKMRAEAEAADATAKANKEAGREADAAAAGFETMEQQIARTTREFYDQLAAIDAYKKKVDDVLGVLLTSEEAQIRVREGIRDLADEVAEGAKEDDRAGEFKDRLSDKLIDLVGDIQREIDAARDSAGMALTAADRHALFLARLAELKFFLPGLTRDIDRYADALDRLNPTTAAASASFNAQPIEQQLDQIDRFRNPAGTFGAASLSVTVNNYGNHLDAQDILWPLAGVR